MTPYRHLLGNDGERLRMQSKLEGIEGAQRPALARLAQLSLFAPLRRQMRVALVRSHCDIVTGTSDVERGYFASGVPQLGHRR